MERRSERISTSAASTMPGAVVDGRMTLGLWLRAGRAQRGMSLDQVARVTKIQPRILERLESGKLDGLPAAVFVRGFVRSFAKCVGLDEDEALQRFASATGQPAPASARALVDTMAALAPSAAYRATPQVVNVSEPVPPTAAVDVAASHEPPPIADVSSAPVGDGPPASGDAAVASDDAAVASDDLAEPQPSSLTAPEVIASDAADVAMTASPSAAPCEGTVVDTGARVGEATPPASKKKRRRGGKSRNKRASLAVGTPSSPVPVVVALDTVPEPAGGEAAEQDAASATLAVPWVPRMPTVTTPTVPWRRAYAVARPAAPIVPSLVIDDADPDSAERELEERSAKEPTRRSFLPPILLDREDRSARQGGLTLAVIILLIAATLTLSYLMRRPSSSGDGVTRAPAALDILA